MRNRYDRLYGGLVDTIDRGIEWWQTRVSRWWPQVEVEGHELTGATEQSAIGALRDPSPHRRWEAAITLGRNSQRSVQAINALIETLSDAEPFVRWQAAIALASQDVGRVFPILCQALAATDALRRAGAAEALGRLGGEAAGQELRKALADPVAEVRVAAAQALGQCGDPTSGAALVPMLEDAETSVRCAAAQALGRLGDERWAEALAGALEQPGQSLLARRALAAALAHTPHPKIQGTLLAALSDPDAQVRGYAAQALGQVGNEAAWTALVASEADKGPLLHGTVGDVARRALTLLERRGRQAPAPQEEPKAD
jgi:HEAT repeat protein